MEKNNELQVKEYTDNANALMVTDSKSLKIAKLLMRQISSLKSLIVSSTDLEYREKKDIYDEALKEIEAKKKDFQKTQNTRLSFTRPLSLAFKAVKQKRENYELKCEQEEQRRIAEEKRRVEADALAVEQKKIDEEEAFQKKLSAQREAESKEEERSFCEYHNLKYPASMPECPQCKTFMSAQPGGKPTHEMVVTEETGVTSIEECFLHGKYDGEECPGCEAERNAPVVQPEEKKEVAKPKVKVKCHVTNLQAFAAGIATGVTPVECMSIRMDKLDEYAQMFSDNAGDGEVFFSGCRIVEG